MEHIDYNSISSIKKFLESEGLQVSKRLGQNFLISPQVRRKICDALDITKSAEVWEIGPGLGAMTAICLKRGAVLTAFELDYGFVRVLEKLYGNSSDFRVVPGDFMDTGINDLLGGRIPDRLLGNLPYSSGSAMVYKIVETGNYPPQTVFTLQREVVQRMCAAPGSKQYSLFSIICGFAFTMEDLGDVAPGSFYPAPDVVSRIVRLVPHGKYDGIGDRKLFFSLAKALFLARRKTIKNNLIASPLASRFTGDELLDACGAAHINPKDRGERLSIDEIVEFSSQLEKLL